MSLLPDLYESLCQQTERDFIWLIVDDGSVDDTESLVGKWINDNRIEIKYYKQKNQGKHIAHNKGIELCETELFFCVDSDDRLPKDAIGIIKQLYYEEHNNDVLGFYLRKGGFDGKPTGENWPVDVKYTALNDLYQKYGYIGEAAIILKTELIKNYTFPQFRNEKFVRESVFYDQISGIAPMRIENKVCYLYKYRDDGYSAQGIKLDFNNPVGTGYSYLHHINYTCNIIEKCKLMGLFYGWTGLTKANDPLYKTISIPTYVKACGRLLKTHYLKLFMAHREALINEV